jgi:hypothetical protein
MHDQLRWIIYYDDGRTFSNLEGRPSDAPKYGVQVIAQLYEGAGRETLHAKDFYLYTRERWWGVSERGILDWVLNRLPELEGVVEGRTISNEDFDAILTRAIYEDSGLPKKSAKTWLEGA